MMHRTYKKILQSNILCKYYKQKESPTVLHSVNITFLFYIYCKPTQWFRHTLYKLQFNFSI
jgi:hypothetical protein